VGYREKRGSNWVTRGPDANKATTSIPAVPRVVAAARHEDELVYSRGLRSRAVTAALVSACVAALGACGGDDDGIDYVGEPGALVTATFPGWVPQIAGFAGGQDGLFVVDTGAPATVLDRDSFGLAPDGLHDVELVGFGLRFPVHQAVVYDLFGGAPGSDGTPDGLIGGELLRHFALRLDYQGGRAALFAGTAPDGDAAVVEGAVTLRIERLGGGTSLLPGDCGAQPCGAIDLPATRLLLPARFEDQAESQWVLVDTGASAVVTSESFLASLGHAAERPRLDGVSIATASGPAVVAMARLTSLELGAGTPVRVAEPTVSLASLPVLVLPSDSLLQSISDEVGHPVVALVGGSFLREFQTTVDYPAGALVLERYRVRTHIPEDEFVGVGFTLAPGDDGSWRVADVYTGKDAAKQGLARDMIVEKIGDTAIHGLPAATVDALFDGHPVGDHISIEILERGARVTRLVAVEDLLPSYP
jgi:hypothetical protein